MATTEVQPPTKTKPATKPPKKKAERLPAETFLAELKRLGLSKSQAAQAMGVSASLVSEFSGAGRKTLMRQDRWPEMKTKLATFAKGVR